MKVLIIEDDDYKLDSAIQILSSHSITKYTHVNNYMDAYSLLIKRPFDNFDFIILDIQFFWSRPLHNSRTIPDPQAGYKFLSKLAAESQDIPVFIFSSVENFEEEYKEFLFPPFSEYKIKFVTSTVFYRESYYTNRYHEEMQTNKNIHQKTLNLVKGHAQNAEELASLINQYLNSNNQP